MAKWKNQSGNKPANAIVYCRVSSKEQTHGYSLENQKEACHRYAFDNNLVVKQVFLNKHGESAKNMNRPAFKNLLNYVTKHHHTISTLVIWKFDRLSRDMSDFAQIFKLFESVCINVVSVTEPVDNTSNGFVLKNMHSMFAQLENIIRKERTEAGMKKAIENGRWVWKPPLGYCMAQDQFGRSILKPDENAEIVREAFAMASKGVYTQKDICRHLRRKTNSLYEQRLNRILRNWLYAGYIVSKKWLQEPVKGVHEPLVSEEVFYRVQKILRGKSQPVKSHRKDNPDFPLRRFVICTECNSGITGSRSKGRGEKRYSYYHCGNRGCGFGSVPTQRLHNQFERLLCSVTPKEKTLRLFENVLRDVWRTCHYDGITKQRGLKRKISELKNQRQRAQELLLKGTLNEVDYSEIAENLANRIIDLQAETAELNITIDNTDDCVGFALNFMREPYRFWSETGLENKLRFQSFVFPKGLKYSKGSFGNTETSILFNILGGNLIDISNLATPTGVEPVFTP